MTCTAGFPRSAHLRHGLRCQVVGTEARGLLLREAEVQQLDSLFRPNDVAGLQVVVNGKRQSNRIYA